jgi:hypothetical protein
VATIRETIFTCVHIGKKIKNSSQKPLSQASSFLHTYINHGPGGRTGATVRETIFTCVLFLNNLVLQNDLVKNV